MTSQDEFIYELKIPKERIAVLIGKQGKIKKEIEETTKTKIQIDSKEGDIFVAGSDGLSLYTAREGIRAIGRRFKPDIALLLLKADYLFEMINISDYAKTPESAKRLKGRVIGSEGKSRRLIEDLTESNVSVYGKTVSIIGSPESVPVARQAVEALLRGSPHSSVYKMLEKRRRDIKRKMILESF